MKTKDFALQVKDVSEEGTFTGYGAVFSNVDSKGEKVMPGAFSESLARHRREGSKPLMLWQHDPSEPIGVWEDLAEDGIGLRGVGRFVLETTRGREAYALLKAGALKGLSIGYREIEAEPDGNVRLLKKLDLVEISVVSFPANRRARIDAVKEALNSGSLPTLPEFERFLREAGFSKTQATAIASRGLSHLLRSESESDQANELAAFLTALRS